MSMPARASLLLLVALALGACAGDSAKKENIEPPTPLVDFTPAATVDRLWSTSVGDGAGMTGASLVPAVVGDRVYAASSDGTIAAYDAATGERLWSQEIESFSGGPGADEKLVVAGTIDGAVIALDAERGSEVWRARVSSEVISAPVIAGDTVIVVSNDGRTHALSAVDGKAAARAIHTFLSQTTSDAAKAGGMYG